MQPASITPRCRIIDIQSRIKETLCPERVPYLPLAAAVARSTAVTLLVGVFRLALVLQSFLRLVSSEGTCESAEESVVCLSTKHTATDAACYGSHQATISLLAVGIVRVAVRVVGVRLTVLVALLPSCRRSPLILLIRVAGVALRLSTENRC